MKRVYAWGALGLVAVLALIGAAAWGYHAGTQAERQRQAGKWADALLASVERAADTGIALAGVGQQLAEALADSHAREIQSVRDVREVVHAHPEFAVLRRPAELQRLRDARHARLSAAAGVPGERDAALRAGAGGPAEPDPGR